MTGEDVLGPLRARIDAIDVKIVGLLAERMACVGEVVDLKRAHGIPARIESRVEEVVGRVRSEAEAAGAPPDLAETVYRAMIDWVIDHEDRQIDDPGRR